MRDWANYWAHVSVGDGKMFRVQGLQVWTIAIASHPGGRGAQSIRETFPKQKPKSRFGCTIPPNQENLLPKTERLDLERPWMREAGQLDDLVSYAGIRGDGGDEGQDQDQ